MFYVNLLYNCKFTKIIVEQRWKAQKNRVSHDIRFSKTNYLKNNLLKQIKKSSLLLALFIYLVAKLVIKIFTSKFFNKKITKKMVKIFYFYCFQYKLIWKTHNFTTFRTNETLLTPSRNTFDSKQKYIWLQAEIERKRYLRRIKLIETM